MPKKTAPNPVAKGFPQHGDTWEDPNNETLESQDDLPSDDGNEPDEPPSNPPDPRDEQIRQLQTQIAGMAGKLDILQQELSVRSQPPREEKPDDFYDKIDEKLFQKPDEVLKSLEERIIQKVSTNIRGEYQKDQGERSFWNDFYAANPDLKSDDDLVKATLQGNMNKLGGMPVSEAITSLATLTRDRISRYSKTPRQRPKVEGSSPPAPKPAERKEPEVITLSDIIKARRNKRRGAAA